MLFVFVPQPLNGCQEVDNSLTAAFADKNEASRRNTKVLSRNTKPGT